MAAISIDDAFDSFDEHWAPRLAAEFNGQSVKLAKIHGPFEWHHHDDGDEVFLVWKGAMTMELRDGGVVLHQGDLYVVPRGVEHRPVADDECWLVLLEPSTMLNTGNLATSERTRPATPLDR